MSYLLLFLRSVLSVGFSLDTLLASFFLYLLHLLWLWRFLDLLLLSFESVVCSSVVGDHIGLVSVLVASSRSET